MFISRRPAFWQSDFRGFINPALGRALKRLSQKGAENGIFGLPSRRFKLKLVMCCWIWTNKERKERKKILEGQKNRGRL